MEGDTRHLSEEKSEAKIALFRRADVGPEMLARIIQIQQGHPGKPKDKHRASFARITDIAEQVRQRWNAETAP